MQLSLAPPQSYFIQFLLQYSTLNLSPPPPGYHFEGFKEMTEDTGAFCFFASVEGYHMFMPVVMSDHVRYICKRCNSVPCDVSHKCEGGGNNQTWRDGEHEGTSVLTCVTSSWPTRGAYRANWHLCFCDWRPLVQTTGSFPQSAEVILQVWD